MRNKRKKKRQQQRQRSKRKKGALKNVLSSRCVFADVGDRHFTSKYLCRIFVIIRNKEAKRAKKANERRGNVSPHCSVYVLYSVISCMIFAHYGRAIIWRVVAVFRSRFQLEFLICFAKMIVSLNMLSREHRIHFMYRVYPETIHRVRHFHPGKHGSFSYLIIVLFS